MEAISLNREKQVQSLIESNHSVSDSGEVCLHQLFEAQVKKAPHSPALIFDDEILTYHEFNRRANQVAHYLKRIGVTPETLVGIFMERSLEMVIAMYGILKAGGAYLPLDPDYPADRIAFMMKDAGVPVLLTQNALLTALPNHHSQVVCLDTAEIQQESESNVESGVTPANLAYVIYTSGSTGNPKGVMIEHRGICNQLQWMQSQYPLSTKDGVLLKTPFSFDLSLYEFFSPLIAGARLVIAEPGGQKDGSYLIELMQREKISTLFMVPSQLQMLLEDEAFSQCESLQHIFCSGEALPFALQQRFFARMPRHIALHNLYGPTEASVECTYWDCERDTKRNFVPVGRPITNYQIYIVDEQFNPVPTGTAGELLIGGIGLARGYLNRPELTSEKFRVSGFEEKTLEANSIPGDPSLETRNSKRETDYLETRNPKLETIVYRTGDLARVHPDGVIECLGRIDFQVKIRGHRIELGEIEAILSQHDLVRECVVVAREDIPGDKRLVAYYVGESELKGEELRHHLGQKLPDYMIPSLLLRLDSLPLSPNGKIDRKQLPSPEEMNNERDKDEVVSADNKTEAKLVEIWESALHLHPISVTDNFFELGGHSLLAVRIFAEIETHFGKRLPLVTLFQSPTIRQLAVFLQTQNEQSLWTSLVPLQPNGNKPPFFCVHAIGGNVLEYYELAQQMPSDQPFYGLQSVGLDGKRQPLTSIEEMASQYIKELRQLRPQGPYHLGGRSFGGVVAYEMAQQLREQNQEVAMVALLDTDPIGWLKRFPRGVTLKYQARFLVIRIQRHLTTIEQFNWRGKIAYFLEKANYKRRKVETWQWQVSRKFNQSEELPLADTLRDIEEFNYLAAKKYVPRAYPDRITFFSANEEVSSVENQFGWQSLATGGVEVVEVPGNHQSMIENPNVQLLAEQLDKRLTRKDQSSK